MAGKTAAASEALALERIEPAAARVMPLFSLASSAFLPTVSAI